MYWNHSLTGRFEGSRSYVAEKGAAPQYFATFLPGGQVGFMPAVFRCVGPEISHCIVGQMYEVKGKVVAVPFGNKFALEHTVESVEPATGNAAPAALVGAVPGGKAKA